MVLLSKQLNLLKLF